MSYRETSGLANFAKENRINWAAWRRCPFGRHIYVDGFCACGQISRHEVARLKKEAQKEIAKYEAFQQFVELKKT